MNSAAGASGLLVPTEGYHSGPQGPDTDEFTICPRHRGAEGRLEVCKGTQCVKLHVCRLYILNKDCPCRHEDCPWGHHVKSERNRRILKILKLDEHDEEQLREYLRMKLESDPVQDEEYRSLLAVCPQYATGQECKPGRCYRIHVCPNKVDGRCDDRNCQSNHTVRGGK